MSQCHSVLLLSGVDSVFGILPGMEMAVGSFCVLSLLCQDWDATSQAVDIEWMNSRRTRLPFTLVPECHPQIKSRLRGSEEGN